MTEKIIPYISEKKLTVLFNEDDIFENAFSMLINSDSRIPIKDDTTFDPLLDYVSNISPECLMFVTCPLLKSDTHMLDLMRKCGYERIYVFCRNIAEASICKKIGAYLYERLKRKDDKQKLLIPIDPSNCFDYIAYRGLTGAFIATDLISYTFYSDIKKDDKMMADLDTRQKRMVSFIDNCHKFDLAVPAVLNSLCDHKDGLNMYENVGLIGELFNNFVFDKILLSKKYHTYSVDNSEVMEDNEITETELYYPFPSQKLADVLARITKAHKVVFKWVNENGAIEFERFSTSH